MEQHSSMPLLGRFAAYLLLAIACAALLLIVVVPMDAGMQLALAGATMALMVVLNRFKSRLITLALVVMSVTMSTRYLYWRTTETLVFSNGFETVLGMGLYLAEIYAWLILILGYIQCIWPLKRQICPLPDDDRLWPTVDIYIPTYNESLEVVQDTILAAQNIDYPADKMRIYVLDDGRRPEFGAYAAAAGVGYITRPDNAHAKAGNLNHALGKTQGELICIFDCDHISTRIFLQATVGGFLKDERLALVQTPHHFYSPDPFERNLSAGRQVPNEGELFYGPVQQGNDYWNAAFFCGSCAVIRRAALEEIGGFAVETVTEDAHTALKLQRKGWNTAFIPVPLAAGLATERLGLHIGQRMRWARGMTQIFRRDNPLFGRGLKLPQRLCYLNAMMHFQFALPRIIFLTSPLAFLLLGQNVISSSAVMIFAYALPHLVHAIGTNARIQGRHRHSFWGEIYETVLAFHILKPTLVTLIDPKRGKFNVTDKGGLLDKDFFDSSIVRPHLVAVALLVAGIAFGVIKYFWIEAIRPDPNVLLLNIFWAAFSLLILLTAIATALETRQIRLATRLNIQVPVVLYLQNGRTVQGRSRDISMGGVLLQVEGNRELSALVDEIEIDFGGGRAVFPVEVVRVSAAEVRLRFRSLSIPQRRLLVRVVMGRADAWVTGRQSSHDVPLRSLWTILRSALTLLFRRSPKVAARAIREPRVEEGATGEPRAEGARAFSAVSLSVFAVVVLAVLAVAGRSALAAETVLPPLPPPPASGEVLAPLSQSKLETFDLAALGIKQALRIRGQRGEVGIPFSINRQEIVTEARLHLHASFSEQLQAEHSSLDVLLNGELVQNIALSSGEAAGMQRELVINPLLLQPFNRLNLRLNGHLASACANPLHPAIWAEIDQRTSLQLTTQRLPFSSDLDSFPEPFFDAADLRSLRLPIVLPDSPSESLLENAAMVAAYFGAQARYRGASFPVYLDELPVEHAVVFALAGDLPVAELALPDIDGPTLAVLDNPRDPLAKLLLVSGRTPEELRSAALNLVLRPSKLKGKLMRPEPLYVEQRSPYDAPNWISNSRATRFAELADISALSSENLFPETMTLGFRAAPDTFLWRGDNLPMRIRYRFPEGDWFDASRSRLDISLNGRYLTSAPMIKQGVFEKVRNWLGYQSRQEDALIEIPPYLIYGDNQLGFYFNLALNPGENCDLSLPDKSYSFIDADSALDLSATQHFAELPNLSFFVGAGFPFTRMADLSETAVILPVRPMASEIEAMLGLMGRFGDATGYPATGVEVMFGTAQLQQVAQRDLLVVGQLDEQRLDLSPLLEGSAFRSDEQRLRIQPMPMLERIKALVGGDWGREFDPADRMLSGYKEFQGFISRRSPLAPQRAVVMALASRSEWLPDNVERLRNATLNAHIRGDIAFFESDEKVLSYRVGPLFSYGSMPWPMYVRWLFSERPLSLMVILFLASGLAAATLYPLLRARAIQRTHY